MAALTLRRIVRAPHPLRCRCDRREPRRNETQTKEAIMAQTSDIRAHGPSIRDRLFNLRDALAHRAAQRKAYRQTFDELTRLSNRDLADMGINRGMIPAIARQAADEV
jgi:uncharacterized protein YjiS (DUF1127 family)